MLKTVSRTDLREKKRYEVFKTA